MKKYLVVLKLGAESRRNVGLVVPTVRDLIERATRTKPEFAFRSEQCDVAGYLVATALAAGQLRAAIESPGASLGGGGPPPVLDNRDALLIVELGEESTASQGFTAALTWVQRH